MAPDRPAAAGAAAADEDAWEETAPGLARRGIASVRSAADGFPIPPGPRATG